MSRDITRKPYYNRGRDFDRNTYRSHQMQKKRSRSPPSRDKKHRSRSPRKNEKELLNDNILCEISKLPEPNDLWDNQFQEAGYSGSAAHPPSFPQEGGNYLTNYQPQYSGIYEDLTSSLPPASHPANIRGWSQVQMQHPPPTQAVFVNNMEDQIKKEAAIESEMRHQKAALSKQREDCMKKAVILKKELETLKEQRNELHSDSKRSPSPDTKRFLKENTKLQLEIQNKLKTINNVVDMLNGIIGEEAQFEKNDAEEMSERSSRRKSRSPSAKKFNYVYYDPEMHWCRVCNEFPATAKDYLTHLHSPSHHKMASAHMEAPWHSVPGMNEGFPNYPSAPTKRTPIRGLQFFVPSTAWYCKLCDLFIGDLHCASAHLKSIVHSKNYTNFVEQNPHWDTDWMSDRQKAFEKSRGKEKDDKSQYTAHTITFNKDGFHTRRKDSPSANYGSEKKRKKNRKKKKSKKKRSSSESDSSTSSSDSDSKKTKRKKEKVIDEKALSEWMSSIPMNHNERRLLDDLKSRAEVSDRRRSRSRDDRGRRNDRRKDDRREERSRSQRDERTDRRDERDTKEDSSPRSVQMSSDSKKPEIKKMPFIGKMPVFKNLGKTAKNDDQKKDDEKKKQEEEEISKKRRVEMDAEIQKKVAQFKEKIAKAQLEKEQQEMPPALALPAQLSFLPQPALLNPPMPPAPTPNNLPKDFQDALDIIFPSNTKPPDLAQQELFVPGLAGFGSIPGVVAPFAQFGVPGVPPVVMGFDLNAQLFPPRPQLYDTHVPLVPGAQKKKLRPQAKVKRNNTSPNQTSPEDDRLNAKNKEELDELAMLGIDASDVGACI